MIKTDPHEYYDDVEKIFQLITYAEYNGDINSLAQARILAGQLKEKLWDDGCQEGGCVGQHTPREEILDCVA
jgi:hypothetical protein